MDCRENFYYPVKSLLPQFGDLAKKFAYFPDAFNYSGSFLEEAAKVPFILNQLKAVVKNLSRVYNASEDITVFCRDVLNPFAIPHLSIYYDTEEAKWSFASRLHSNHSANAGNYIMIQDENFLFAIRFNKEAGYIEAYIYKK